MNVVRSGDSDSEVEQIHNQLKHLEFDVSIVDNQFGQKTKLAIE
jgi:peptidoglycan hydrolase-like protein with peptidoglycan-binding domain